MSRLHLFALVLLAAFGLSLLAAPTALAEAGFRWKPVDAKSLGLWEGDKPVLVYNHGMISKQGVPARYTRACYLHPVYGLDGEVITEDFPKDHRHHRGIFWAWPHVRIDGKEYNSWVPTGIRYKLERWVRKDANAKQAVLEAHNGWYVGDKKVADERLTMTVHAAADAQRIIDLEFTWTPTDRPISLQGAGGKSYGGLTVRFNTRCREKGGISGKQVRITVPNGVAKRDLPDTKLQWADFTAPFPSAPGRSGAAVFVDKSHPDYPPTWLTRHYGCLCVGWPGVRAQTLQAGKSVTCRYRVLVHRGDLDLDTLKKAYAAYLNRR